MHKTFRVITGTLTIIITIIFITSSLQTSFEQEDTAGNWTIGESNKLSFKYPSHWDVNVSDSRFDNYELLFRDQTNNASIQVSDEALSATNKFLMGNDPERYLDIYLMNYSPLSTTARLIEEYPKGKVSIAGLPAYSELYLDQGYAVLISVAFQEGSDRHYTVFSASPSSNYDKLESTMLEIIKSVTPKSDIDVETIINKIFNPVSVNSSFQGDAKAKIVIVEFADYQCPFCAKFHKETKDLIMKNFVETGKVKFLFKDLIVNDRPYNKASTIAASASYCAAEQGKYWEYNAELYKNSQGENTGWVTKDNLKQFANNTNVSDLIQFSDCIDSDKYNMIVEENDSLGKNIGLTSTPTFIFYNGTKTPVAVQGAQPYELFEQIINEME